MRDRHVTATHHHKPQLAFLVTLEPHTMPCSGPHVFVLGLSLQTSTVAHLSAKLVDACSLSLNCSKHCHSQVVEGLVELRELKVAWSLYSPSPLSWALLFVVFPGRAVARVALRSGTATHQGGREGCVLAPVRLLE